MIILINLIDNKYEILSDMKQRPTIRQLEFLIALYECQNFSKAATACFVTQSTMSAGIKELETILSASLVERTRRSLLFTTLGKKVVAQARSLILKSDEILEASKMACKPFAEPIRCGIIPTIAPFLLPDMIKVLKSDIPGAKLYIREDKSQVIVDKLKLGELDIIIVALPYPLENLVSHTVGSEKFVAAVMKEHPLAKQTAIPLNAFKNERVLMLEEGNCLRDHALSLCKFIDTRKTAEFQGTSLHTLLQMVGSGLGMTIIPEMALRAGILNNTDLVAVPIASSAIGRDIAVVWRENSPREEEFSKLTDIIGNVLIKQAGL